MARIKTVITYTLTPQRGTMAATKTLCEDHLEGYPGLVSVSRRWHQGVCQHPDCQIEPSVSAWHVPPECQGRIIELAYGLDTWETAWRRTLDRSTGITTYDELDWDDLQGMWEPWNRAPEVL